MRRVQLAAAITVAYAASFGAPSVPVSIYLHETGRLPSVFGRFEMYAGPWSERLSDRTLIDLLLSLSVVTTLAGTTGVRLWRRPTRVTVTANLCLLPVEMVFWAGFALPLAWPVGIVRLALLGTRPPHRGDESSRRGSLLDRADDTTRSPARSTA